MTNRNEPPPIIVNPTPVPSDEQLREWESLKMQGRHIVTAGGERCACWCGARHVGRAVEADGYYFGVLQ